MARHAVIEAFSVVAGQGYEEASFSRHGPQFLQQSPDLLIEVFDLPSVQTDRVIGAGYILGNARHELFGRGEGWVMGIPKVDPEHEWPVAFLGPCEGAVYGFIAAALQVFHIPCGLACLVNACFPLEGIKVAEALVQAEAPGYGKGRMHRSRVPARFGAEFCQGDRAGLQAVSAVPRQHAQPMTGAVLSGED